MSRKIKIDPKLYIKDFRNGQEDFYLDDVGNVAIGAILFVILTVIVIWIVVGFVVLDQTKESAVNTCVSKGYDRDYCIKISK